MSVRLFNADPTTIAGILQLVAYGATGAVPMGMSREDFIKAAAAEFDAAAEAYGEFVRQRNTRQ